MFLIGMLGGFIVGCNLYDIVYGYSTPMTAVMLFFGVLLMLFGYHD